MSELTEKDLMKIAPYLNGVVAMDVKILKRWKGEIKQVILEYRDGSKKICDLSVEKIQMMPYEKFSSVNEYVSRVNDGIANYPGNCCGKIIEQFLNYCKAKLGNVLFAAPMKGSGTEEDVARRLGIPFWASDLRLGFNVMKDDIPILPNCSFVHVPYFVPRKNDGTLSAMPIYSGKAWGNEKDISLDDGSHLHTWSEYIHWLNETQYRLIQQLRKGGYLGILMGASRASGKYYDPITEMNLYGDLDSIVIKKQTNCSSDNYNYKNQGFIEICHEYLMIIRKRDNLIIPCTVTKHMDVSIMKAKNVTWKALIANVIEELGGKATKEKLFEILKQHPKAESNNHLTEKIRQVLNTFKDIFVNVGNGVYALSSVNINQTASTAV